MSDFRWIDWHHGLDVRWTGFHPAIDYHLQTTVIAAVPWVPGYTVFGIAAA